MSQIHHTVHRVVRCLVVLALFLFLMNIAESAATPQIETTGGIEEVFVWKRDRCEPNDIPDSPARAIRLSDGNIAFVAAHYTNQLSLGSSFKSLKRRCDTRSLGHNDSEPAKFNDRYWIQAMYPLPTKRILALVSHEYLGYRHEGRCAVPQQGHYPTCWYSSVLMAMGSVYSTVKFDLPPLDLRVVAAPPSRYDPARRERLGFLTVSNIVRHDRYLYALIYSELLTQRGNCLFRTRQDQPLGPWLALSRGRFEQAFPSAYVDKSDSERRCDVIGEGVFHGSIKSVVWLSKAKKWLAVSMMTAKAGPHQENQSGVYYSLSEDLVHWSQARRLFAGMQPWGQTACADFYDYPSLIDHGSRSDLFDTADSNQLYLYLTRFNFASCTKGLNRDLIRLRLQLLH